MPLSFFAKPVTATNPHFLPTSGAPDKSCVRDFWRAIPSSNPNLKIKNMLSIFHPIDMYSWLILVSMLLVLCLAAFAGKVVWGGKAVRNADFDDELKVVLGCILSMFGLLVGFILSFAISGLNSRMAAEENEAVAIGNAFQRTTLLTESQQETAEKLLEEYLALRIAFFATDDDAKRADIRMESIKKQAYMLPRALPALFIFSYPIPNVDVQHLGARSNLSAHHVLALRGWVDDLAGRTGLE